MKKLRLQVEDLRVESFTTAAGRAVSGVDRNEANLLDAARAAVAVLAELGTVRANGEGTLFDWTCNQSCGGSCNDYTCDVFEYTCNQNYTCRVGCGTSTNTVEPQDTCYGGCTEQMSVCYQGTCGYGTCPPCV